MYQLLVTNTLVLLADSWICQSAHFRCFFTCASPRPVQSGAREKRLALRSSPALSVRPATRCETGASAEGERTAQSHPQVRTALLLTLDVCEDTRDAAKMHALCEEEKDDDADAETHTHVLQCRRARACLTNTDALVCFDFCMESVARSREPVRASHRC